MPSACARARAFRATFENVRRTLMLRGRSMVQRDDALKLSAIAESSYWLRLSKTSPMR